MTTHAIGDIQGCFKTFQALLEKINFNPKHDKLWLTGDLINRGPQSLETLRFCYKNRDSIITVLGNHDLHFLGVHYGVREASPKDTLDDILNAPDRDELCDWLCQQPLLHSENNYVMVHAGIAPCWDLAKAQQIAKEVEQALQGEQRIEFFENMFANTPNLWNDDLTGWPRLRCAINYFTRMRFCHTDQSLDLTYKGDLDNMPAELTPWFKLPNSLESEVKVIFGHWAALMGQTQNSHLIAIDTGCIWGNSLSAYCFETQNITSIPNCEA